ncbi:putative WW domain-containing protein [Rosellinia necatrix]|uniref:Putative WW domain-containing protein n=1 Tax=Rosellinia necatrix TaxID=77044 RepID=A0A1W2TFD1_ROSNE|nr:putative WW domain-containing protein [Rosellinia necatrix]
MLKSTYKPSANLAPPPLPPGWTEHKAPTGHTYYYHEETKESTYKRPGADAPPVPSALQPQDPHASFFQYSAVPRLSDPAAANAFLAQYDPARQHSAQAVSQHGRGDHRGPNDGRSRPRPQPSDKPKSKVAIPGCEPWILVYTKYGRRFAYNPVKNASYWRIPEKVMKFVIELDIKGIKEKAGGDSEKDDQLPAEVNVQAQEITQGDEASEQVELGSDYEEVEVTDDEEDAEGDGEPGDDNARASKRQRTDEPADDLPVEFNEADIAYQLQAMGEDYGLDPGEYDDGNSENWPEGAEGLDFSETDAKELFKDLLNDFGINPYSPWDKLIEDGHVFDDSRYTVLTSMKARKEVWEEWSRERIQVLKEQRAKEEKKDPKIPYMAFLQQKATPKLYWAEFRRKYKKEGPMRDTSLNDRDREKWYRDYINRLKLPQDVLKKDLTSLLKEIPTRALNNQTLPENLPSQLLADVRYISLDPKIRDPMLATYIQTLGPPPEADEADEDETSKRAREERRKREKALAERERVVAEEKRKQERQLEFGKAVLREEERELERANQVGKKGLQSQLLAAQEKGDAH